MDSWVAYVIAFGVIFGTNLLPAFAPPTWTLLVFFKLNTAIPLPVLVVGGAIASSSGRFVLATVSRHFRGRFSAERLARLERARTFLEQDRRWAAGGLVLFLLSPLPSAQLFVAAGLIGTPLVQLTAAFFVGRLVSYSLYLGGATLAQENLGDAVVDSLTSPAGIAAQLVLVAGIVALLKVDFTRWLPGGAAEPVPAVTSDPDARVHNDDGRPKAPVDG